MSISKKVISAVTSAALLASLLATAVAPAVGAATDDTAYLGLCAPTTCSVAADGISRVQVFGQVGAAPTGGAHIALQIAGATFSTAAADAVGFTVVDSASATLPANTAPALTDLVTVIAPSAAGTATISVFVVPAAGNAVSAGTFTLDFYAAGSTAVSAANSTVTASTKSLKSDGTDTATVTVVVKNGITPTPTAITSGITVNAQITPVGLINNNDAAGFAQVSADALTTYVFNVKGSGIAGAATLSLWVTTAAGVRTDLAPVSFVFSGKTASVVATGVYTALAYNAAAPQAGAITFVTKDAAGNRTASLADASTVVTGPLTAVITAPSSATVDVDGQVSVQCTGTLGSGTVAVKDNAITSNAVTVYCSDVPASFTAVFDQTVVSPGGTAKLTVTIKDAGGRLAPDTSVNVVVSAGALTTATPKLSKAGVASWTWLAPFNTGVVSAYVTLPTTDLGSKIAQINVGAPVPVATLGSTAATLGVAPPGGTWSTSTKVAKVGEFITWRFAAGISNAGKTIGVFVQTKDANGVWSAPVRFSARVADSSGNAYFSWKGTKAMWVSVRGGLGDARSTPPVQGRWQ